MAVSTKELQVLITAKDQATKKLTKITGVLQKHKAEIKKIGMAMTAVGAVMTAAFAIGIKQAAIAEGSYNKFNTVFGEHKDEMLGFVTELRKTMPAATSDIVRMAADLQDLLVPLGLSREAATGLSKGFLNVANKIAAFNDVDPTEVLEAIKSGLAGSSEPLKRFGVNALETALEVRALKDGLIEQGQSFKNLAPEIKNQIRAQALLAQITENSSDAIAGFEANNDSFIRRQQDLNATIKETSEMIGKVLLPIIDKVLKKILPVVEGIREWIEANPELAEKIILITAVIAGMLLVLGPLLIMLPGLVTAIGLVSGAIAGLTISSGIIGLALLALGVWIIWLMKHWDELRDGVEILKEKFIIAWTTIKNFFIETLKSLAAGAIIAWDDIKNTVQFAIDFIQGLIITYLDWLIPTWKDKLKMIEGFIRAMGFIIAKIWETITNTITKATNKIGKTFDLLLEGSKIAWDGIASAVSRAWDSILDKIMSVWNKVKVPIEKVTGFLGGIGSKISDGVSVLGEGITSIAEKGGFTGFAERSEEHTSELQSH